MNFVLRIKAGLLSLGLSAAVSAAGAPGIASPDRRLQLSVGVDDGGVPYYSLEYKGQSVLAKSRLGFVLRQGGGYADGLTIESSEERAFDETWRPVWGEVSQIRNHYNELAVTLAQPMNDRRMIVRFRLYDDGLGFRYEFPAQPALHRFEIGEELTEFNLARDYTAFCMPGDYDTSEFTYTTAPLSQLRVEIPRQSEARKSCEAKSEGGLVVQTPLMLKGDNGLYVNIHEAALVDYAAMELRVDDARFVLSAALVPDRNGSKGYLQAPCRTPWRTVIVSDDARDILASKLILNLNEPCAYEDTSWIRPMKFIGVWWEYFIGTGSTWSYSDRRDARPGETDYATLAPHGHHGATTENAKRYVDFAADNGFDAVLVEGWNEGWEDWGAYTKSRHFRFDRAYPDFDVEEVQAYAAARGVRIMMHHETAGNAADYERQLDDAFRFMADHGYNAVKTGYVGPIIPRSEYHASQWMNDHYIHVVRRAADYRIMVDSHEAVRPTGLCRTYPNWLAQESARGTEFESMGGNPADHTTILPFTRLVGGPMDYTPGIFQGDLSYYKEGCKQHERASSTLARQLALYVTIFSPLQMAADLPENYKRFADAFRFIREVAVDWDDSRYLEAEPGDYVTVARRAKGTGDWFVGCTADENGHRSHLRLDFLTPGRRYLATVYADAPDAHYRTNPQAYIIRRGWVDSRSSLTLRAAPGGGYAIRITELPDSAALRGTKRLPSKIN